MILINSVQVSLLGADLGSRPPCETLDSGGGTGGTEAEADAFGGREGLVHGLRRLGYE